MSWVRVAATTKVAKITLIVAQIDPPATPPTSADLNLTRVFGMYM